MNTGVTTVLRKTSRYTFQTITAAGHSPNCFRLHIYCIYRYLCYTHTYSWHGFSSCLISPWFVVSSGARMLSHVCGKLVSSVACWGYFDMCAVQFRCLAAGGRHTGKTGVSMTHVHVYVNSLVQEEMVRWAHVWNVGICSVWLTLHASLSWLLDLVL